MNNKLIPLIMTVVVGVILAGSLLVPVLNDATNALHVTKTNDFGVYANAMDDDLTVSIGINATDNTKWDFTVNDVTINYPVDNAVANPVLLTDKFQVLLSNNIIVAFPNARYIDQVEFTATLSDGILSGSSNNGDTTHTYTSHAYEWAFYASDVGDYRTVYLLSNEKERIYYKDIDDIYGTNFVFTTGKFYSFNGADVNYYTNSTTPTEMTATVTEHNVSGTVDMKYLDIARTNGDYTFVVDNSGVDYTVNPWVYIVPASVTSDAIQNPGAIATLYGAIPILVIVAILMAVVGAIALRRGD